MKIQLYEHLLDKDLNCRNLRRNVIVQRGKRYAVKASSGTDNVNAPNVNFFAYRFLLSVRSRKIKNIPKLIQYSRFKCIQSKPYRKLGERNFKKDNVRTHEEVTYQQVDRNFVCLIFVKNDLRFRVQPPQNP